MIISNTTTNIWNGEIIVKKNVGENGYRQGILSSFTKEKGLPVHYSDSPEFLSHLFRWAFKKERKEEIMKKTVTYFDLLLSFRH